MGANGCLVAWHDALLKPPRLAARRMLGASRMRRRRLCQALVLSLAALAVAAVPRARAGDAAAAFRPYEDLTEVLATLAWHLDDDLYRFPAARDPTGHAVFGLVLARLERWETRFPNRLRDVTAFARAQALERLGAWERAARAYEAVAAMSDSPLASRADAALQRARRFAEVSAMPEDGPDLRARLPAIARKLDAWNALVQQHRGTPYEGLALLEEEQLERRVADLLVRSRHDLEGGDETAERALRFLIQKHAESKELPAHVLALADLQAAIAREWLAEHDRPLAFDEAQFLARVDRALETYRKVATWDGTPEKLEGQGRFAALEAWKSNVLARYR